MTTPLRTAFGAALLSLLLALTGTTPAAEPSASAPSAPSAPHSAIPFKQDKHGDDTLAYQSIAGLVLAGLAAYGIVLGLKHFGGPRGTAMRKSRRLHVHESLRLSRHSVLHVVNYRDEELLLAENEHGIQLLGKRPVPEATDDAGAPHA